jgi:alpha-methylacyl-CoA racemase
MGPLAGVKIIEIAGIGPGPFCGMMLADMGAEVIRVDRASGAGLCAGTNVLAETAAASRSPQDPKRARRVLKLCEHADALIEGFRPGVAERLGVGPDQCMARNPKLVYGRMTGWGQDGPLSQAAGHDINYIALSGALHAIGRRGSKPVPPLNLVGDFGGGGMLLAFGMVCALLEAQRSSGQGQVVDASMVEGSAALMAMFYGLRAQGGGHSDQRGTNMLDTGAHFYDTYETSDGKYVAIGSIEPQFYAAAHGEGGARPGRVRPQLDRNAGPSSEGAPRRGDATKTATSGAPSWRAPTCASRPCCRSARRPAIPTTSPATPLSRSMA